MKVTKKYLLSSFHARGKGAFLQICRIGLVIGWSIQAIICWFFHHQVELFFIMLPECNFIANRTTGGTVVYVIWTIEEFQIAKIIDLWFQREEAIKWELTNLIEIFSYAGNDDILHFLSTWFSNKAHPAFSQ